LKAKDKSTGKENKITIKANSGLSEEEIEKMVRDAEANAEEDRKQKELIDARNQGDSMIHTVKKDLNENKSLITEDEVAKVEEALKSAEEAIKGSDKDTIEKATNALIEASSPLIAAKSKATTEETQSENNSKSDNQTIDAEFTEVKED
jgi:molecular chaperone DnaK